MFNWRKTFTKVEKPSTLGQLGEQLAAEEYKKRGYTVVAANEFNRKGKQFGEIDLIVTNRTTVVFIEVKTRQTEHGMFGTGIEAVNVFKQRKIMHAVHLFLQRNLKYQHLQPRVDVCSIVMDKFDKEPKSVTILENVVEDWN